MSSPWQPRWFPGYRNGATMVVVDPRVCSRAASASRPSLDPRPARRSRAAAGEWMARAPAPQNVSDVFEVTSFLTVRWSYTVLTAFGILIGIVVVVAQVLVLDARVRRSRQAAVVITRRMGFDLRSEATAIFVELAVPLHLRRDLGHRRRSRDRARGHRAPRHPPQPAATRATSSSTSRAWRPRDDRGRGAPRARRPGHDHHRQDQTDGGDAQCRMKPPR